MPVSVTLRGQLDHGRVGRLLAQLLAAPEGSQVAIDLSKITFVTPSAIVALTAGLHAAEAAGVGAALTCPDEPGVLTYMAALGFLQGLPPNVDLLETRGLERTGVSGSGRLVPLTRLSHADQIQTVVETVGRLDGMFGAGGTDWIKQKQAVLSTITEICLNIFHHSALDHGWLAAQTYFNGYTAEEYIDIGIGDAGRGIRASLTAAHEELENLPEAEVIRKMLDEHLSSRSAAGGTGYYVLQKATRELDGGFWLRSGLAQASRPRRGSLAVNESDYHWQGTFLHARLTCRPRGA